MNWNKEELLLQDKGGNVLGVFKDGRITCDCLMNCFNKQRDYASQSKYGTCKHATKLLKSIPDLTEYEIIK